MKSFDRDDILAYLRSIKPHLQEEGFEEVGLFGSFARNEAGVYSDIDIAVRRKDDYLNTRTPYEYFDSLEQIKIQLRRRFGRPVDVVDLSSNSAAIRAAKEEIIYA
jgi:predicted nucleotidyltransferase